MDTAAQKSGRGRGLAVLVCAVLLLNFWITSRLAWRDKSATVDEPLHLVAAYVQTQAGDFRCNPEDPPLWKYYVAAGSGNLRFDRNSPLWDLMLSDVTAQWRFVTTTLYRTPGNEADAILGAARSRMIFLGVLLGATIAWWAWRLAGPLAAIVAAAFYSLDPNFLAHASLVKNDVPITLVFLLLMAALWRLGERATLVRIAAVCLLVAAALLTKFSGLLALPLLAIALLGRVWIDSPWHVPRYVAATRLQRFFGAAGIVILAVFVSYLLIWAAYDFRFSPSPDGQARFVLDDILQARAAAEYVAANHLSWHTDLTAAAPWIAHWQPGPAVRVVLAMERHHFLPQSWLAGFLYTYASSLVRSEFLCGQIRTTGWWYYFPLAMHFKTPVATQIAVAVAIGWMIHARLRPKNRAAADITKRLDRWTLVSVILAPALYMVFAMTSNLDIGLRHVLPVYPFLFIFVGAVAARAWRRFPKPATWSVASLFALLLLETWAAYPNFVPFFNVAAGGSTSGINLLSDSNLDWGQDLPALARWQREHPDRQLYLCYFGSADPRTYGIHYLTQPGTQAPLDQTRPSGLPAVLAISATALQGTFLTQEQIELYAPLRKQKPIAILGGSIYLFDAR